MNYISGYWKVGVVLGSLDRSGGGISWGSVAVLDGPTSNDTMSGTSKNCKGSKRFPGGGRVGVTSRHRKRGPAENPPEEEAESLGLEGLETTTRGYGLERKNYSEY